MKRIIEPDLKYCPQCDDEYRAEIARCATCKVDLIAGSELLRQRQGTRVERSMVISPNDELVSIRKGSVVEMKQLQTLLKREGIPSLAVNEDGSCGRGCCGPSLTVQVRRADLEVVMAILKEDYVRTTFLAEHASCAAGTMFSTTAETAVCPACGHAFSAALSTCPDCGLCFAPGCG